MEISRLQEIFTEKVLSQSEQIFEIHTTSVETTGFNGGFAKLKRFLSSSRFIYSHLVK